MGRAEAIQRLALSGNFESEDRFLHLPEFFALARDYFPYGSGAGTFDPVYRVVESDALLGATYYNHAHNELVETLLTGGLLSVVVLGLFVLWWLRACWRLFARGRAVSIEAQYGRAGAIIVGVLLLAGLVDYPMRTPLLSVVFAVAACWLAGAVAGAPSRSAAPAGP
jgi:O-antigen ligase